MSRGTLIILIGAFATMTLSVTAQNFVNGSLNGTIGVSTTPTSWGQVAYTEPMNQATASIRATSDVTGTTGPVSGNINANPYQGTTLVSGLHMSSGVDVWHEGIEQTVTGFVVGNSYTISLFQIVVKQSNVTDNTGSWAIYRDNVLVGTTVPTTDLAAVGSNSHVWERRTISFTATAAAHLIRFLPMDDDGNFQDLLGVRMGIDSITLRPAVILPISIDFELALAANAEAVQLTWQDIEAQAFSIERSPDGLVFESAGSMEANAQQVYNFRDEAPFVESHYRIGALQMDGDVVYSEVKSIRTQSPVTATLSRRILQIQGGYGTQYMVTLLDLQGKEVFGELVDQSADLQALASGIYFLRVVSQGKEPILLEKKLHIGN